MGITYSILIVSESGEKAQQPLPVKTDTAARAKTAAYAKAHPEEMVFCVFNRTSDGQVGYINRDGADVTGHAY
jgi:hypothetical protein